MAADIMRKRPSSSKRNDGVSGDKRLCRYYAMRTMNRKVRILFLCTGNSCRSQMAEGWSHRLKAEELEAYSAGIEKHGLNPLAAWVMAEKGVDISDFTSKNVDELPEIVFDYVITLCGHADETCPVFTGGAKKIHVGFDDPPTLAAGATTQEEELVHYRRVRDEIRVFVESLPETLL